MNIAETAKKVINHPEKFLYGLERKGLMDWMSEEAYIKAVYRLAFGRKLHLDHPEALSEKINWYKLNYRDPLMRECVDKYEVRSYVEEKVGRQYLNDMIGIWDSVDDIDFRSLPDQFVLKPTNGSGDVVICRDKKNFDWKSAKKKLEKYSGRPFCTKTKEWAYYGLPHRILGERLIKSSDTYQIKDYKMYCFRGKKGEGIPKFLYVVSERDTEGQNYLIDFFDIKWRRLPVAYSECGHNLNLEKPEHFEEMLMIAHKLAEPFPFVRVDLYEEKERVYFGEMTFYPYAGFLKFVPDKWDFIFGKCFDIDSIEIKK